VCLIRDKQHRHITATDRPIDGETDWYTDWHKNRQITHWYLISWSSLQYQHIVHFDIITNIIYFVFLAIIWFGYTFFQQCVVRVHRVRGSCPECELKLRNTLWDRLCQSIGILIFETLESDHHYYYCIYYWQCTNSLLAANFYYLKHIILLGCSLSIITFGFWGITPVPLQLTWPNFIRT